MTTLQSVAGVAGFEPTNADTKNRCLTTWRHPNCKSKKLGQALLELHCLQTHIYVIFYFFASIFYHILQKIYLIMSEQQFFLLFPGF